MPCAVCVSLASGVIGTLVCRLLDVFVYVSVSVTSVCVRVCVCKRRQFGKGYDLLILTAASSRVHMCCGVAVISFGVH